MYQQAFHSHLPNVKFWNPVCSYILCTHVADAESVPVEQKVEPALKPLEEKPVKERVDDEGKEQPLTGQSPVSTSSTSQVKAVQMSPYKRVQVIVFI